MPNNKNTCDEEYQEATLPPTSSGTQMEELRIEPAKQPRKSKYFYLYSLILLLLIVIALLLGGFSFLLKSLKDTVKDGSDLKGKINFIFKEAESRACNSSKISYFIGTEKVTWFQAYSLCKQSGMELASVFSVDQEIAVEDATRTVPNKVGFYEGYWLAGTKHGGDWVWFTTGKPVIYKKFYQGQPDNAGGNEVCLELFLPGPDIFAWNDAPCDLKFGFVCQSSNCW